MSDRVSAKTYVGETRRIAVVSWPGTGREVGLLLLNCQEVQDSAFEAREHFDRKRQPIDQTIAEQWFLHEVEYQLVRRMLIDPDSKRPEDRVFASAAQLRSMLSPDLVQWFLEKHSEQKAEYAREVGLIEGPADGD